MSQLASFQYDIFQRYFVLAKALETAFPVRRNPARVLDLGSGPEPLTRTFLPPGFEVTAADVETFDTPGIVLVERGKPLPFADASFDAVVCMDVLEHIPALERELYLSEMGRVAAKVLVVAFPHDAANVKEGERLLDRGYVKLLSGRCEFLVEHEQCGLPDHRAVSAVLRSRGHETFTIGISPLAEWLLYSYFDLLALSAFNVGAEKDEVNRRFNSDIRLGREPEGFYRAMIVASRSPRLVAQLDKAVMHLPKAVEAPEDAIFEFPLAAFDATLMLVDRLRKKSYQDVFSAVAQDLSRLAALGTVGADHLAPLQAGMEGATRALGEIRHALGDHDQLGAANNAAKEYREALEVEREAHRGTLAELDRMKDAQRRVVMESTTLVDQVRSLEEAIARQAQLHEMRLGELESALAERTSALEAANQGLADARQQRDANGETVRSLAAALQRQAELHETEVKSLAASVAGAAQLHEVKIRELEAQLQERAGQVAEGVRALAQAREEHAARVAEGIDRMAEANRERERLEAELAAALALQAQQEEKLRETGKVLEDRATALATALRTVVDTRRERDEAAAARAAMQREMEGAQERARELEQTLAAERNASKARVERIEFALDTQKVELGRMAARLRCEKRARLMDLQQLESARRAH
ncbi:MAG TPA: methyltransferase domain-containing protein [Usitatibacter sp.]|nr:methyltransferase domain-containing protein [Usitatibacter sp.]